MAEKPSKPQSNAFVKPVPMKLFAAWEVDRTPHNCIPRLCTLTLTRLVLVKPVGAEITSITIAVKMQSSKRTLRSNEIMIPSNSLLDTELDLAFSLQYPHFLKRNGNLLQITLQKRKKYKNRAILGFKTLAGGIINMAEVLQRPMDRELELYTDLKEKNDVLAKVTMLAVSSQPVDHDQKLALFPEHAERLTEGDNFSDEDDDFTSNEEGSDSEAVIEEANHQRSRRRSDFRKAINQKMLQTSSEERPDSSQRNIKQRFIALLKKFRVPDSEVFDSEEQYQEDLDQELISNSRQEIEDLLFDELEDLTDSGPEVDDVSITSTPKPSLRPFFSSSTLVAAESDKSSVDKLSDESGKRGDSDSHPDPGTEQEPPDSNHAAGSPPKRVLPDESKLSYPLPGIEKADKDKKPKLFTTVRYVPAPKEKRSPNVKEASQKTTLERTISGRETESSPRKMVLEQLAKIFPADDSIPDHIYLIHALETVGNFFGQHLQEHQQAVITASSSPDIRASMTNLVNKIQKFCNCNARAPGIIRIGILGQDAFINTVLRVYVEHFSGKPPEWQTYVRFYVVPLGTSSVAKYLANVDSTYGANFSDVVWRDLLERCNDLLIHTEPQEAVSRILNYMATANSLLQVPIAEAMVTYKEKSSDDESCQVFIPFICDVKIGLVEGAQNSVDYEDQPVASLTIPSSSPPSGSHIEKAAKDNTTPPSSPSISYSFLASGQNVNQTANAGGETMDLQIDYWIQPSKSDIGKKGESNKFTLKTAFRTLHVFRLPGPGETSSASLTVSYITKEKKQKIMRLGKKREKEREPDVRHQVAEGVHRLICSCKNPQAPLKVIIDGVEWTGVKFFQLTAQWQTHIKFFPVAVYSGAEHVV